MTNVHIPTDRGTGSNKTFAFVSYRHTCSVKYACELFNMLRLFRKPIYCKPSENKSSGTPTTNQQVAFGSPNYSTPAKPGRSSDRAHEASPLTTPQLYSDSRDSNNRDSERRRYGGGGGDYRRSDNYDRRQQYDNRYDNHRSHGNWAPHNQNQWGQYGQNYNDNRNSPSNYGPMRNDPHRHNNNRNNRRQNPY